MVDRAVEDQRLECAAAGRSAALIELAAIDLPGLLRAQGLDLRRARGAAERMRERRLGDAELGRSATIRRVRGEAAFARITSSIIRSTVEYPS